MATGSFESRQTRASAFSELERRGARYRIGAPLDVRWLAGGWSSHFEFFDPNRRRVRCDFVSRPPRVSLDSIENLFSRSSGTRLLVIDPESLILMKQTQRAKDYAVIGELAGLLPAARELELTTDPDRVLTLAPMVGASSHRPAVRAALSGAERRVVVSALAEEVDVMQQQDASRMARYEDAAKAYLTASRAAAATNLPLREAHARLCEMAERLLPTAIVED
jgi:hypothetical protein